MNDVEKGRLGFQLAYGDCDAVGIAYFAIYYRWMERTYTSWLYSQGIRGGELQEQFGVITVGLSSGASYHRPARVFDLLTCQTTLDSLGYSSYRVGFDFTRDGEPITTGQMTFACRDLDWAKAAVPQGIIDVLATLPRRSAEGSA